MLETDLFYRFKLVCCNALKFNFMYVLASSCSWEEFFDAVVVHLCCIYVNVDKKIYQSMFLMVVKYSSYDIGLEELKAWMRLNETNSKRIILPNFII